jgi:predicted transcriptional regulator
MIKMKLIRKIKGEDLISEYKEKYGELKELKKLFEKDNTNVKLELDIDEWEYFKNNPDEILEQTRVIYTPKGFSATDMEILDIIKNEPPKSINELANLINLDVSNVLKKLNTLKKEGIIELSGNINNTIPVFNYDTIEIKI